MPPSRNIRGSMVPNKGGRGKFGSKSSSRKKSGRG